MDLAVLPLPRLIERRRAFYEPVLFQEPTTHMSSAAQINANRANAQLSTGPTSDTGKAKSSLNAVKTGLTGRTVLLPGDDAAAYEAHVAAFFERHQPATDEERNLVQSLADTEWRLLRIPSLEMGIYAVGRIEFADLFPQEDPDVRKQLIEAKVFLAYQRQINNLSIQENRLRRQREKDVASLKQLQDNRKREERKRLSEAAQQYIAAVHDDRHTKWDPRQNGFEFPMAEIELRALDIEPDLFAEWAADNAA
ncbi:MAG: hypothetical protein JOZ62_11140 [Acidobacteriaceae bacterium]|nr:hypothetical protein [Acidobacteriaceae bacterium]